MALNQIKIKTYLNLLIDSNFPHRFTADITGTKKNTTVTETGFILSN